MAKRKSEAWLTSALDDDAVTGAMVLAESLRRTRTTRTLAVIIVDSVSPKKRVALRKSFDGVFCLDDYLAWKHDGKSGVDDTPAKIYAFSLVFFDKCVYLPPTAVVLENVDYLFEDKMEFKALRQKEDGAINLSSYMFQPREEAWEALSEFVSAQENLISERLLGQWLSNQSSEELNLGKIPKNMIARYSTKSGLLMTNKTHAPIVQLVVGAKNGIKLPERIKSLAKKDIGLREKLIAGVWLEIFHQQVGPVLECSALDGKSGLMMLNPAVGDDDKYVNEPIAIIGMSCRYPGANNVEEFWNMLYEGREGVREPPAFRWTKEHSLRVSQQERKTNAGFLSSKVDEFDAKFFGVSPKEAAYMDPQARLLHEVMWESLEDSGIDPLSLYGTHTGIFTGSWMNDYKDIVQGSTEKDFFRTYMGNSIGAAAARLSFLLGLTGPSIATESGCSSAIVALDLAVKSLRNGETKLALAGGVNLLLHPFTSNIMDYVIAPNGRCKTFDSNADGFGRAEGCGVLVLKRMSDALRDRDNIWAVIRGSAVSQEGLSRSLGTPTVHCEALAMQLALEDANVLPGQVSFVETHGTGTSVGDPMEVAAITKAYYSPSRTTPLVIGSVKTNVGHTESCSGITGIMKTILALQHELIPKHRNLESLNPEIFLDSIPAMIPMEPVAWPKTKGRPRIAGVSSFGITGTDGHVIIQEAPDYELPKFVLGQERPKHLLKISGKSAEALDELLTMYQNLFSEVAGNNATISAFRNAAFSANVGRASFNHRAFIVAHDYQNAAVALQHKKFLQGEVKNGENQQICFLFTGQGSQYQGMAKSLYDTSPVFRIHFDACDRTLKEMYNLSIREVLWGSESSSKELSRTIYSQTSIFCVEYCLLRLWQSWGIQPDYVLGHSLGEFCAAVAAGLLDFQGALKLVAERSRLIDSLPRGSMLVIKASKLEVDKLMKSAGIILDYAAVNNPEQTVVAGDTEKVQQLLVYLKSQDVKAIILEATHAFHSRHMDPMLENYRKIAETIEYKEGYGSVQYVSGMEGRIIADSSDLGADYWVRHTREKVSFTDACTALREVGCQDFLEIGPQPVLSSFVMMNNEDVQLNCMPSLRRGTDDWETILNSLGKLYLLGFKVDWKGYDEPYTRNKVSLPFHPFHKKPFWVECTNSNVTLIHPLIGHSMNNASALNIFQNDLTVKSVPYVKDHCIGSRIVYPGAGFTEMCLSAGYCVANGLSETLDAPRRAMRLENVRIEAPLELKEEKSCRLQVLVELPESTAHEKSEDREGFRVKVYHQNTSDSETEGKWVLHASSTFIPVPSTKDSMKKWNPDRIAEIISTVQSTTPEQFYKRVNDAGLKFGESFRMIQKYWAVKQTDTTADVDEIVTEMAIPADFHKYLLHPLIIDAVFQSGILSKHRYQDSKLKVPVRVGQLTMFSGIENDAGKDNADPGSLYIHAWHENDNCFVFIATENYTPIALVEDIELLDTNVKTIESVLEQQSSSIPDAWEEVWKALPSPLNAAVELPDVEEIFADPQVQEKLRAQRATSAEDIDIYNKTKKLLYLYIVKALLELGWNPVVGQVVTPKSLCEGLKILPAFQKLVRFYLTVLQEEGILKKDDAQESSWIFQSSLLSREHIVLEMTGLENILKSSRHSITTSIYEYISKSLSKILIGEESALALLFPLEEDKQQYSADHYYQTNPSRADMYVTMKVLITSIYEQCQAANDPNKVYRLLEVGSGTGSLSQHLLEWLEAVWGDRFELYYTDISQSFLYKAEKKFEKYSKNVKYAVFNIEQSPLSQGIPLNYFDMVCATDVLHATRKLEESVVHIRQTLRPGGALVFTETIIPARDITFVFGLLDGYWRYQDLEWRQHHCCVSDDVWGNVLKRGGFESVHSSRVYVDQFSCITAIASPNVKVDCLSAVLMGDEEPEKEWVVFAEASNFEEVTSQVVNMLEASGNRVTCVLRNTDAVNENVLKKSVITKKICAADEDPVVIKSIVEGDSVQGIIYTWGMDLKETSQRNVSLPFLQISKSIVGLPKPPLLYVFTKGVHAINEDTITCHPTPATIFGMMKALKNESYNLSLRYVDLDQDMSPAQQVDQMLFELAMNRGQKEQQRVQVAYRGNQRFEPRFVKTSLQRNEDELKLPPSTDRYHLVLPKSRVIQDLEFDTLEEEQVGEAEVEIKIKTFALNFKDILTILKPSAEFEKLNTVGLDFAGIVTKAGASAKFACGDRVFGANFKETQLPSHLVLDSRSILKIPDSMTFWEAATLPAVFSTAYHCLINIAKMKKGDTVLIHTGSGGVGLAAIQVAKHVGATIITTAGNARKRAYLKSLGIHHVFHSRNTSFEKDILNATNGRGVDVVLNSITGPGIKEATLNSTATNGRFVEMSKLSTWAPEEVKAMRPDVDYTIVDLTVLEREAWDKLLDRMKEFLAEGHLKPIPYVKYDALNIRQALQYFQKAKHIGKVVCAMPEVTKQGGQFNVRVPLFNSESTYLITGGLGGIGFEVCKWMLGLGATDIMLTGRSPPKPEVALQIQELNDKGLNVMVMLGDIGDLTHCKAMISEIDINHKPLRGAMHCAGVLRDNLFPNQTWDAFEATFAAKVSGTWNLHEATRELALEHFVLYSSLTALVGTPGQPNHSAANCFEDAFIHYRHSLGLPGTTINWGQWAQVGCAKEISVSGILPVSMKRMLNGLEITLKTNKRQVCFSEFESFNNFGLLCPIVKGYLDDRLWKQISTSTQSNQGFKAEQFWKEMDAAETKAEKETVLGGYLKSILRAALRLEPDETINDDANIQELGVDSLMMIELKNSIQSLLGSRVTVNASLLKNCNTVRLIANAVVGKLVEDDEEEDGVFSEPLSPPELMEVLTKDCILDASIQASSCTPAKIPSQIETVLVTGVTGQLGPYIVSQLMTSYQSVSRIVCLVHGAGEDASIATEKLKTTFKSMNLLHNMDLSKLECVLGDIALENFGIPQDKYANLCSSMDAVIHCAVKTHHAEHYIPSEKQKRTDIRSVNVGGLLNVLRFASISKVKHVFYPSVLVCGIWEENDAATLPDNWPNKSSLESLINNKIPGLYTSKFVCELLLEQATERGIPCKVFRFPWIAGESSTGQLNFLNNMYILRFLSFLMVNAIPSLPLPANILPVNICAELSLKLFFNDATPCEIFNVSHPQPPVEQEFVRVAKEEFGKEMSIVEWKEFVQTLQEHDTQVEELKGLFKDQKQISMYMGDAVGMVKGYVASPDTFFESKKVATFIPNYNQNIPLPMDTIRRDLHFLKSVGFLEKFGI